MKKIRILCIDGGGIRGIIPAVILNHLEKTLEKKARKKFNNRKSYHLSDFFDFIAGTSTGGILTALYLLPNTRKRPKFNGDQVVDFYLKHGDKIFENSIFSSIWKLGGLSDEKYNAKQLEKLLEENAGNTKISQLLKPSLITSYDFENRRAVLFTSHNAVIDSRNFFVKDIARATSAAPTYFEPAKIKTLNDIPYTLIDGGLFANNPTLCAYSEVKKIAFSEVLDDKDKIDNPSAKDMVIVSIGTGDILKPYKYKDLKDAGALSWIKPIIDILMSSNAETTSYHIGKIFKEIEEENERAGKNCYQQYFRLDPDLYDASPDMDNAKPENIQKLKEAGLRFVNNNYSLLEDISDVLLEEH